MNHPIFFVETKNVNENQAVLDKDESHHAIKVMRLSLGAQVVLVDGFGTAYRGEVAKLGRNNPVEILIHSTLRKFGEPDAVVSLASGLSTNSKFDFVVEKATELGVKRIIPLLTEKSKIKLDDPKRLKSKQTRYEKIARSAIKQCRRSYIPEISLPVSFKDYLKEIDPNSLNLIFHPGKNARGLASIDFSKNPQRVNIIIGPESGLSEAEIELAKEKSIQAITLGSRIMRTETAGPVILGIIMNLLGELR